MTARGAFADVLLDRIGRAMLDIVFIAAGLAFFALAAGYVALCERL